MRTILRTFTSLLALIAAGVFAVPATYTLPPTTRSGSTFSGTLTFDQDTSTVNDINISASGGSLDGTVFNVPCGTFDVTFNVIGTRKFACGQSSSSVPTDGSFVLFLIDVSGLPQAIERTYVGGCAVTTGGICTTLDDWVNVSNTPIVLGSGQTTPPAGIPTLSEWFMILMAGLMALLAARAIRSR